MSYVYVFYSSRRRHTRLQGDWSSDVCSSFPSRRRHTRLQGDWSSDVCSFFPSRRRHTRLQGDWSSDVCSSDLELVRVELDQRDIEALRPRPRRRPLGRRVGGAATHARQHPLASQLLPQHDGQEGRIDPARVADEGRWVGPDEGAQLGVWCLGSGHGGIVAAYTVSIKGHERIVRRPETCYPYDTFKNYHKRLLLVGNQGTGAAKWRTRPSWTPSTGRSCGSSRPTGDRVTRRSPMKLDCRDPR